jgi:cytidyltransferase-like protein
MGTDHGTTVPIGPDPLLISRAQVDTLYVLLRAVTSALQQLDVPYILTGGSLLGAVRQHSILFTDDDVDIAIVENATTTMTTTTTTYDGSETRIKSSSCLDLVREQLPHLLGDDFVYTVEAWENSDRVRFRRMSNVFLDVFCIRRYETIDELRGVLSLKKNGQAQSYEYVASIVDAIQDAAVIVAQTSLDDAAVIEKDRNNTTIDMSLPLFPCWHFDRRKAIELWPREVYRQGELFPLASTYAMGPITGLSGPHLPVTLLQRAFGIDCFVVYYESISHSQTRSTSSSHCSKSTIAESTPPHSNDTQESLPQQRYAPHILPGGTWQGGTKKALLEAHYRPMQPIARAQRRPTLHCQSTLRDNLQRQTLYEQQYLRQNEPLSSHPPMQSATASSDEMLSMPCSVIPAGSKVARRTVYMDGVFDLFHVGHWNAIQQCAALGDRVLIGVVGDADAASYKRPPIVQQDDRVAVVAALGVVDKVICPCPLIVTESFMHQHGIDLVVHGFANDDDAAKQEEFFRTPVQLGKFQRIDYYQGLSTTDIIQKIQGLPSDSTDNDTNEDSSSVGQTQNRPNPKWFGAALATATRHAPNIPFDPFPLDLRIVIEPHIAKARANRSLALQALCDEKRLEQSQIQHLVETSTPLTTPGMFEFDVQSFPLRETFLLCGGLSPDFDLAMLHETNNGKNLLCHQLTQRFRDFQLVYDDFVRKVCVPRLAAGSGTVIDTVYYQAFPCVRIVQPREFSIGPHSDIVYAHHAGSINFYLSFTAIQGNTASLFLESRPGSEDWHPILTATDGYGTLKHFAGAMNLHWTTENTTEQTRLSLDFRLIPGSVYDSLAAKDSIYRDGFYSCCRRPRSHDTDTWEHIGSELWPPDARTGFPWTVKAWASLLEIA